MIIDFIVAILWSLSPFGEAKVGIPYGMLKGLNIYWVFVFCFLANVLVFPMMMFFWNGSTVILQDGPFTRNRPYSLLERRKRILGIKIKKYGFSDLCYL